MADTPVPVAFPTDPCSNGSFSEAMRKRIVVVGGNCNFSYMQTPRGKGRAEFENKLRRSSPPSLESMETILERQVITGADGIYTGT